MDLGYEPPLDPPDEYWGIEKPEPDWDAIISRYELNREYQKQMEEERWGIQKPKAR